ncbi:MAG: response regulator [Deltaproteobacteria bacterium]|nr:response regulator [Deltaproteobacteria bacterium]
MANLQQLLSLRLLPDRLLPPSIRAGDPAVRLRAELLVLYSAVVLTVPMLFAAVYLHDGLPYVAGNLAITATLGSCSMLVLWKSRSMTVAGNYAVATFAISNLITLVQLAGEDIGSMYWLGTAPILASFLAGRRSGMVWLVLTAVAVVTVGALSSAGRLGTLSQPPSQLNDVLGAVVLSALLLSLSLIYERSKDHSLGQLQATAAELDRARARAEAATDARTAFLAHMSHEIRTPMNGVIGMADVMLTDDLPPNVRGQLRIILESSRALVAIIDDILDFAKADAGHLTLVERPTEVRAVVAATTTLLAERARAAHLTIDVHVADSVPPSLLLDAGRLRQVVINLVSNAIKFTRIGGVKVAAAWSQDRLAVAVSDTGIGIAAADMHQLFSPFRQVDAKQNREFGGTGLGLVICKQIVEAMGGQLHVQSEVGVGTTFRFEVNAPLAPQSEMAPRRAASQSLPVMQPCRVLLVEDNAVNCVVAQRMLQRLGHQVVTAEAGDTAVDLASSQDFDLILMDCHMPGVDGLTATRMIRALDGPRGRVPVVALTASALAEDRERCQQAGMTGFLAKPLEVRALAAEMEAQLLVRPV